MQTDFATFVREAWPVIEPNELIWGWHMTAICMHLEAVRNGDIDRMLINVPPGASKSMLTSVLWPAWCWTTQPDLRFLCCSHSLDLALRDSVRCRRLIQSEWYQSYWPLELVGDQNAKGKYENNHNGFRQAVAAGSVTGARADHFIIDDPHSVESASSEAMRATTADWFLEAVPTRLNRPAATYDSEGNVILPASTITIIMQRLNTDDVSGLAIDRGLGYEHLMLPMEFESDRRCVTSIGFMDPRTQDGELLFPARFPREVVERDKKALGPYAYAGQMQQRPAPKGGGIIKRSYWGLWDDEMAMSQGIRDADKFPPMDLVIVSVDTAYTEKKENDASYITVWGLWQRGGASAKALLSREGAKLEVMDVRDTMPTLMLMWSRELRVTLHGEMIDRDAFEPSGAYRARERESWGLVEWIKYAAQTYNADHVLIEAKASGLSVADELKRLNRTAPWTIHLINPGNADKVARAYAAQATFANGQVYAPDKSWADHLITQAEVFPKGKNDDGVDSLTQAINWLRERRLLERQDEIAQRINDEATWKPASKPIYQT